MISLPGLPGQKIHDRIHTFVLLIKVDTYGLMSVKLENSYHAALGSRHQSAGIA